jgi:hypothetical protein
MEYSNILFRFIHHDSADAKEDHLLSIKQEDDGYLWSYREVNRSRRQEMSLRDAGVVLGNLQRMFHMMSWDEDPYDLIQVIIPGYPMVMLKAADMKESWPTLREFLEGVFENWPVNRFEEQEEVWDIQNARPSCGFDGCPCECDEDDADNEVEGVESDDKTDPDMPALVSQEDDHIADILLRMLREPAPTTPPVVRKRLEPHFTSEAEVDREEGWVEEAERREPIEIRRVVNTPNGPRTYIRFV